MTAIFPKRRPAPPEFAAPLLPDNLPVPPCPAPRAQALRRVFIMRAARHMNTRGEQALQKARML